MSKQVRDITDAVVHGVFIPGPHQAVTTSGTTARTASNFAGTTQVVRLCATAACYVVFGGSTVEATSAGILLPALSPLVLGIPSGATRVAAIQVSGGGVLSVLEMA